MVVYVNAQNNSARVSLKKTGLVSIYYDAVNNNADLASAKAQYKARQEVVPQARAGLLPQINANANYENIKTVLDRPATTIKRNAHVYAVNLTQPVFRVDRWFQLQAAHAANEQAYFDFAVTQQQLILQTAQVYFNILQAQDDLAANQAEENAYKRQADEANARFDLGLADKTDYLQAKAAYDMSRAKRIVSEKNVEDAFQALTTLTNRYYEAIEGIRHNLPIRHPIPNNATAWVDKAVTQNLSLRAGFYSVAVAEETLKQRKAGHAPTVDFVASYQRGDNDAFNLNNSAASLAHYGSDVEQTSVGVQLQMPLYSGGMTSSQVREARSNLMMSEYDQESLRRKVVQNTRNYHRAVNTDIEQIKALRQTIISSQSAVEATQIGFQSGTRNIVDVLDAQRQLYDAVRNYNNARYAYIIDSLSLKEMVGTLSPLDLQELEAYLNPNYEPSKDFLPPELLRKGKLN
ncbi:TolC family outer membrane protein [Entomomonas asaccharolytica]|uniref:TolC family outer membrane protein n=1 Tax=Entomomonas asaccharolytica TaxID=2785331 RepID=A0A974NI95_9GAMM|nr:TolC family outer membrane protein [Entomomonas asaccharolytica]QQP87100.1 TolC family outer membrane protein [Entomomonas asaccharolytica]